MLETLLLVFLSLGFCVMILGFFLKAVVDWWAIQYEKEHPELRNNFLWNLEQEDNIFR